MTSSVHQLTIGIFLSTLLLFVSLQMTLLFVKKEALNPKVKEIVA